MGERLEDGTHSVPYEVGVKMLVPRAGSEAAGTAALPATAAIGEYNFAVEMRSYKTNLVLGRSRPQPQTFPTLDRLAALEVVFRFDAVPFPSPEVYVFQVFANGEPVEGGVSFLRVLPG